MSDDEEPNPGPDIPPLKTLLNVLTPVHHKWRNICIQLGIPNHILRKFEKDNDPLINSLDYWLSNNTKVPITWGSIVAALESSNVGELGLAKELKEKYCMEATDKATKQTIKKDEGLVTSTNASLKKNDVSVGSLRLTLKNLGLDELVEKLHDESDLTEALIKASDYWSFFDYETLTSIISFYCKNDVDLQQEAESYISNFGKYCQRRLCEVPIDNFETEIRKKTIKLYVKMDETFTVPTTPLNNVKKIARKLSSLLGTSLSLLKIEDGCIKLIFSCLRKINLLFPLNSQQEEDLLKMGVLKLYDDICEYYPAPSQEKPPSLSLPPSQLPAVKQPSSMVPLEMSKLLELNDSITTKENQPVVKTMEEKYSKGADDSMSKSLYSGYPSDVITQWQNDKFGEGY